MEEVLNKLTNIKEGIDKVVGTDTQTKSWFEANYLDGDEIQKGQMLSSDTCCEAVKQAEQRIIKEFIEKLMVETSPGKPLSVIECIDSIRSKYQIND